MSAIDRVLDAPGRNAIGRQNIERLKAARADAQAIATTLVLHLSDSTPEQQRSALGVFRAFVFHAAILVATVTQGIAAAPEAWEHLQEVVEATEAALGDDALNPSGDAWILEPDYMSPPRTRGGWEIEDGVLVGWSAVPEHLANLDGFSVWPDYNDPTGQRRWMVRPGSGWWLVDLGSGPTFVDYDPYADL